MTTSKSTTDKPDIPMPLSASTLIPQKARALNAPFADLFKWDTLGDVLIGKVVGDITKPDNRGKPWRTITLAPVVVAHEKGDAQGFGEVAITATATIEQALPIVGENPVDYRGKCYIFHYSGQEALSGTETLKRILVYDATAERLKDAIRALPDAKAHEPLLALLDDSQRDLPF